jgi:hypothetical protein
MLKWTKRIVHHSSLFFRRKHVAARIFEMSKTRTRPKISRIHPWRITHSFLSAPQLLMRQEDHKNERERISYLTWHVVSRFVWNRKTTWKEGIFSSTESIDILQICSHGLLPSWREVFFHSRANSAIGSPTSWCCCERWHGFRVVHVLLDIVVDWSVGTCLYR